MGDLAESRTQYALIGANSTSYAHTMYVSPKQSKQTDSDLTARAFNSNRSEKDASTE
jgi:hypothetical protein